MTGIAVPTPLQDSAESRPSIETIIAGLYGAAAGRNDWSEPLADMARRLNLWCLQLMGADKRNGAYFYSHEGGSSTAEAKLDYVREYHAMNPRVPHFVALGTQGWVHDHRLFDPRFIESSPFFQEFLIPHGGCLLSGTKLVEDERQLIALAAVRGVGQPPLADDEVEELDRLKYHFREALSMRAHLRNVVHGLGFATEILAQFDQPMLLIDDECAIMFRNASGDRLLAAGDGWIDWDGYLAARTSAETAGLRAGMGRLGLSVSSGSGESRSIPVSVRSRDGTSIVAFLSAIRPAEVLHAFGPMPLALVSLYDPREHRPFDPVIIREAFGMTPAEAKIAAHLAQGQSISDIAEHRQVAIATIRRQTQAAFGKLGVQRQADLVRVLSSIPALASA